MRVSDGVFVPWLVREDNSKVFSFQVQGTGKGLKIKGRFYVKTEKHTVLERIKLALVEEMNSSRDPQDYLDKASLRLLELFQDEAKFGKQSKIGFDR